MKGGSYLQRLYALLGGILVAVLMVLPAGAAQLPTPTAEQLRMLQQLTPEQRALLMEQLGKGSLPVAAKPPETPELVIPRSAEELARQALPTAAAAELVPARLGGGDTLLIEIGPATPLPRVDERSPLAWPKIPPKKLYVLDGNGVLDLPDVGRIPLGGLTEEEAAQRLGAEPALAGKRIGVKRLPVEAELKPFGYDLFSGIATTFAPATDIPVPVDYVVGPGDMVMVQLYGKESREYSLPISRDGVLNFPGLGVMPVAGMTFRELKEAIVGRVARQFIGMQASVSMGPLRSIRVFVLGDVNQPGSYTVSALSTMTNALLVSGGVKPIGSLRSIELKRNGGRVATLDLYDLLLRGDTRGDARLQPGDVIFVPPVGATLGVEGQVRRPAIYELKSEASFADVLALAGGLLPTAYPQDSRLVRIDDRRERVLINVDLGSQDDLGRLVRSGDTLHVPSVLDQVERTVTLKGHVQRPGPRQWRAGMRLSEVISSAAELQAKADMHYLLIRRELGPERRIEVHSVDLQALLGAPGGAADLTLQPGDEITVFSTTEQRQEKILPLIAELTRQAQTGSPRQVVQVSGRVWQPGEYPLERGMRVSDLIRAGGQLQEAAYVLEAELTRYHVVNGQQRETGHFDIDLAAILSGDEQADLLLDPYDALSIREVPQWRKQGRVTLAGEVRFPGDYPIVRGETLRAVIARAGGFSDLAYLDGAVFTRDELRLREQENLNRMAERLESDLAALSLENLQGDPQQAQAFGMAKDLVAQIRKTKPIGRLVIDLHRVYGGEVPDVVLKDGDALFVPIEMQEVTVLGEVFQPTSHLYAKDLDSKQYVELSGGFTQRADKKRIYIVRANGAVVPAGGGWFSKSAPISPGDTVVAPLDAERMRPLLLWTNVSQILYQLGVAAASWKTVGAL